MLRALPIAFALLSLTRFAGAYPIGTDIRWDFVGAVHYSGDSSLCCNLEVPEGSLASGSFEFHYVPGNPMLNTLLVRVSLGSDEILVAAAANPWPVQNHDAGAGQDSIVAATELGSLPTFLGLLPGWGLGGLPHSSLSLIDLDGAVFQSNPRTNDYVPDYPPPASLFETATIFAHYPIGSATQGQTAVDVTVDIIHFVPEPGAVTLVLGSLAVILTLGPSAARTPRSRRARARGTSGGRVTRA